MKATILAVDDDPILCAVYEVILGELYNLHLASSGEEALAVLQSYVRPDIILLDIMMPGMNGYETCQKIRATPLSSPIKVILVSAKALVEERLRGYEVGADDYIIKPFEESELLAKINVFLRLKNVEEIDSIKRNFLRLLSHETRTPLNGILGVAQILQDSPNLSEEEKELVSMLSSCGTELLSLSEKTMLLSELRAGNIHLDAEPTTIIELLAACQHTLTHSLTEKQLALEITGDVGVEINGDPKLLQRALQMVLDNAVKFARPGTVVGVRATTAGDRIQIAIANEGELIPTEHHEDIFTAFFVQNIDHHHHGHGLSLEIARRLVAAHDGTLSIQNHEKGPVFLFDMPTA
jgi:signal transduction histidine kinase